MKTVYEQTAEHLDRLEAIQVRVQSALTREDLDDVHAGLTARGRELESLSTLFEALPTEPSERPAVARLIRRLETLYAQGQRLHEQIESRSAALGDALREFRGTARVFDHAPVGGRRRGMWCDVRR